MNTIKYYLKEIIKYFIFMLLYLLIINAINYFTNINQKTIIIINYIFTIISLFIIGFITAKKSNKKALINGLIISTSIIIIFILLSLIFKHNIKINSLVYYLLLIISCITGSVIRKNINY